MNFRVMSRVRDGGCGQMPRARSEIPGCLIVSKCNRPSGIFDSSDAEFKLPSTECHMCLTSRRAALALGILFTTWSQAQVPAPATPEEQADRAAIESLPKGPVS